MSSSENLLKDMISGKSMTASQQIGLTVRLSIPAILAQISSIVMQYIDASMVGVLVQMHREPSDLFRPRHGCLAGYALR